MPIRRVLGAIGSALVLSACPGENVQGRNTPDASLTVPDAGTIDAGEIDAGTIDAGTMDAGSFPGTATSSLASGGTTMSSPSYRAVVTLGQGPGDNATMSSPNNVFVGGVAGATQGR